MNSTLSKVFIFATGAVIGSVVTWRLLDEKYKKIAQDEIDSYKEYCKGKYEIEELEEEEETSAGPIVGSTPDTVKVLYSKVNELGYTSYSGNERPIIDEVPDEDGPEVIPPDECGEIEEYDIIELQYFEDEVLTDEKYIPIDDADDLIGKDALDHFGEWEDDSVYVRNDERKAYYIILRDPRKYSDVQDYSPHRAEDK